MRKIIIIFVLTAIQLCVLPVLFAQKGQIKYEDYFIAKQDNLEDYQQYYGRSIAFYEPKTTDQALFNLNEISYGVPYVIKKIYYYYSLAVPTVEFVLTKDGDDSGKKYKIKCRNLETNHKIPGIYDFPAYWYEPATKLRNTYLGKKINENGISFTVTDLDFDGKSVFLVYTSDDGKIFKEPINDTIGYVIEDKLLGVEKPVNEAIRYGETTIIKDDGVTKYSYIDNNVAVVIFFSQGLPYYPEKKTTSFDWNQISFSIQNLSDSSQKIIWDEAAFVDSNGKTSKVIHSGIKYSEREKTQIPSIIVRGATITDSVTPVDNIDFLEPLGWVAKPLFKPDTEGNVALLLPIQIKGVTNEYLFAFQRTFVLHHPELREMIH